MQTRSSSSTKGVSWSRADTRSCWPAAASTASSMTCNSPRRSACWHETDRAPRIAVHPRAARHASDTPRARGKHSEHAAVHPRVLARAPAADAALALPPADHGDDLAVEGRRVHRARLRPLRRRLGARLVHARRLGGARALGERIRAARAGRNIVFTPDGPKGPARVAKDGVVVAAQATGLPIVPIAFAAKKKSCCAPGTVWSSRSEEHTS